MLYLFCNSRTSPESFANYAILTDTPARPVKIVAMYCALLKMWWRFPLLRLQLKLQDREESIVTALATIATQEMTLDGGKANKRSLEDDGLLHFTSLAGKKGVSLFRALVMEEFGVKPDKALFEASAESFSVDCSSEQIWVSCDGELVQMKTPLDCRVRPKALSVLVPEHLAGTT